MSTTVYPSGYPTQKQKDGIKHSGEVVNHIPKCSFIFLLAPIVRETEIESEKPIKLRMDSARERERKLKQLSSSMALSLLSFTDFPLRFDRIREKRSHSRRREKMGGRRGKKTSPHDSSECWIRGRTESRYHMALNKYVGLKVGKQGEVYL
uniref:Uncharacterized protein n=1 Tax=Nelumbo nucifera TaxID=4432 RepID=A0A822YAJ8_NELNU|nr:TPA_asm: hypothetical protein HUJ06_029594 [Nelumbo nucifera]